MFAITIETFLWVVVAGCVAGLWWVHRTPCWQEWPTREQIDQKLIENMLEGE